MRSFVGFAGLVLAIAGLAIGNHYNRPDLAFWVCIGFCGATFVGMLFLKDREGGQS